MSIIDPNSFICGVGMYWKGSIIRQPGSLGKGKQSNSLDQNFMKNIAMDITVYVLIFLLIILQPRTIMASAISFFLWVEAVVFRALKSRVSKFSIIYA